MTTTHGFALLREEKIVELKNIKKMNSGSVKDVRNNISLMMSNLYYRMILLADFITEFGKD